MATYRATIEVEVSKTYGIEVTAGSEAEARQKAQNLSIDVLEFEGEEENVEVTSWNVGGVEEVEGSRHWTPSDEVFLEWRAEPEEEAADITFSVDNPAEGWTAARIAEGMEAGPLAPEEGNTSLVMCGNKVWQAVWSDEGEPTLTRVADLRVMGTAEDAGGPTLRRLARGCNHRRGSCIRTPEDARAAAK